jgi:hypothetical protein
MPTATAPYINASNAAAMAKLGWEKRRARALEELNNPKPEPIQLPTSEQDLRTQEVLVLIRQQIENATEVLNDEDYRFCEHCKRAGVGPKDRALLLGALDRLLERERVWSQRAGPGNLKPTSQRQRSGPPTPTV